MHRHKQFDPSNPEGRWVFPYILLITVSGVMIVGFGQHDRFFAAALCFIPLILGVKLLLRAFSLMDADVEFRERYEQRRATRPITLSDYDTQLGEDICRATRHDTGEIRRS